MKTIVEFLKTDVNYKEQEFYDQYIIVHAVGDGIAILDKQFKKAKITNGFYDFFVIDKNVLKEYFKTHKFDNKYQLFKIPEKYKSFKEIEKGFTKKEFTNFSLSELKIEDLK